MKMRKLQQRQHQTRQRKEAVESKVSPLFQRRSVRGAGMGAGGNHAGVGSHQLALRILQNRREQGLPLQPTQSMQKPAGFGPLGILPIQRKAKPSGNGMPVPGKVAQQVQSLEGGGQPLSTQERSFFEPRFGRSLRDVRLHTGTMAQKAANRLNARAFTYGRNIAFGRGESLFGTSEGKRLMAHELVHSSQQSFQSYIAQVIQRKSKKKKPKLDIPKALKIKGAFTKDLWSSLYFLMGDKDYYVGQMTYDILAASSTFVQMARRLDRYIKRNGKKKEWDWIL